jgi:tetratricopeptide (TPR) repeat protein
MRHLIRITPYFFTFFGLLITVETFAENEFREREGGEYTERIETAYSNGKELEETGDFDGALKAYSECVNLCKEATREGVLGLEGVYEYAAEAAFEVAEAEFVNYDRIRLVMPQKTMEANISKRLELSRRLVDHYSYCIDLGIPEWTIAAKVRMGDVNYSFAEALCNAEVPPETAPDKWLHLPPDDENRLRLEEMHRNYVRALEEQAFSLYGQALGFYADALKIAGADNINNEWTRRAAEMSEKAEGKSQGLRAKVLPQIELRKFKSRGQ